MIEYLSAAMGLNPSDPLFWMPLVVSAFFLLVGASVVLMDGFGLGVGLLLPFLSASDRQRVFERHESWEASSNAWLLLVLVLVMIVFPFAWAVLANGLYLGFLFLVTGSLLRALSHLCYKNHHNNHAIGYWLFGLASLLATIGYGLLLAGYVAGLQWRLDLSVFVFLVLLSVAMSFFLLGCTWLVAWSQGTLLVKTARLARSSARWTAAGMVAISLTLGLTNPAVFYKWTQASFLMTGALWWLLMLAAFVWLEICLRHLIAELVPKSNRIPFLLAMLLLVLMMLGLAYSVFPFVIIDEMSIWDAVASPAVLETALICILVLIPVVIAVHVGRLFRRMTQQSVSVQKVAQAQVAAR
jgi:cytochrome bd ubiquinol oxidase subunit II